MANTFSTAKRDLLELVRRPSTEAIGDAGSGRTLDDVAGRAINHAILFLNRIITFQYAEVSLNFTYTVDSFTIARTVIASDLIGLLTVQQVGNNTLKEGKPLRTLGYSALQNLRRQFEDRKIAPPVFEEAADPPPDTLSDIKRHSEYVRQTFGFYGFLLNDGFGLYPTPTEAIELFITYNSLLPELSAGADTNFILEFCFDFILAKAAKNMNIYLKDDIRIQINNDQMKENFESIKAWDAMIRNSQEQLFNEIS